MGVVAESERDPAAFFVARKPEMFIYHVLLDPDVTYGPFKHIFWPIYRHTRAPTPNKTHSSYGTQFERCNSSRASSHRRGVIQPCNKCLLPVGFGMRVFIFHARAVQVSSGVVFPAARPPSAHRVNAGGTRSLKPITAEATHTPLGRPTRAPPPCS